MTEPTTPQLSEDAVQEIERLAGSGALQLPLRVEGWHQSLSDGGWFIKDGTGRILATVAFVPVEIETGKPALEGNAPSRAIVALLNSIPALIRDRRALRTENSTLKKHWADTSEDLASAWLKHGEQEQSNAALREQLAQAQETIKDLRADLELGEEQ